MSRPVVTEITESEEPQASDCFGNRARQCRQHLAGKGYTRGAMRRALIFGLALTLAGLGPLPVSTCAWLSSGWVECKTPKTPSPCESMNMDECAAQSVAALNSSCCVASNAHSPESWLQPSDSSPLPVPALASALVCDVPRIAQPASVVPVQDPSPPPLQSLLCTFLI